MKFGATIKDALYQDWQASYIDYGGLKRFIKDRQAKHQWDDADEADFIKALASELDKVVKFQESKIAELTDKITNYESEVKDLIAAADASHQPQRSNGDGEAEGEDGDVEAGGADDDSLSDTSDDEFEDRFVDLEEDLANVIADVHDLGHFSHLNYTGFVKIVKKHDKRTGFTLKGQFMRDFLEKRPFYKENYDSIIVQLSRFYNLVRTRGHPVQGDAAAGGSQSAFVRQTTKYWVHPDNYVQLKLVILKHLPILVFNPARQARDLPGFIKLMQTACYTSLPSARTGMLASSDSHSSRPSRLDLLSPHFASSPSISSLASFRIPSLLLGTMEIDYPNPLHPPEGAASSASAPSLAASRPSPSLALIPSSASDHLGDEMTPILSGLSILQLLSAVVNGSLPAATRLAAMDEIDVRSKKAGTQGILLDLRAHPSVDWTAPSSALSGLPPPDSQSVPTREEVLDDVAMSEVSSVDVPLAVVLANKQAVERTFLSHDPSIGGNGGDLDVGDGLTLRINLAPSPAADATATSSRQASSATAAAATAPQATSCKSSAPVLQYDPPVSLAGIFDVNMDAVAARDVLLQHNDGRKIKRIDDEYAALKGGLGKPKKLKGGHTFTWIDESKIRRGPRPSIPLPERELVCAAVIVLHDTLVTQQQKAATTAFAFQPSRSAMMTAQEKQDMSPAAQVELLDRTSSVALLIIAERFTGYAPVSAAANKPAMAKLGIVDMDAFVDWPAVRSALPAERADLVETTTKIYDSLKTQRKRQYGIAATLSVLHAAKHVAHTSPQLVYFDQRLPHVERSDEAIRSHPLFEPLLAEVRDDMRECVAQLVERGYKLRDINEFRINYSIKTDFTERLLDAFRQSKHPQQGFPAILGDVSVPDKVEKFPGPPKHDPCGLYNNIWRPFMVGFKEDELERLYKEEKEKLKRATEDQNIDGSLFGFKPNLKGIYKFAHAIDRSPDTPTAIADARHAASLVTLMEHASNLVSPPQIPTLRRQNGSTAIFKTVSEDGSEELMGEVQGLLAYIYRKHVEPIKDLVEG
ncbi:hypothetical protein NBRC10513_006106 [Rhodotorula toruloides]